MFAGVSIDPETGLPLPWQPGDRSQRIQRILIVVFVLLTTTYWLLGYFAEAEVFPSTSVEGKPAGLATTVTCRDSNPALQGDARIPERPGTELPPTTSSIAKSVCITAAREMPTPSALVITLSLGFSAGAAYIVRAGYRRWAKARSQGLSDRLGFDVPPPNQALPAKHRLMSVPMYLSGVLLVIIAFFVDLGAAFARADGHYRRGVTATASVYDVSGSTARIRFRTLEREEEIEIEKTFADSESTPKQGSQLTVLYDPAFPAVAVVGGKPKSRGELRIRLAVSNAMHGVAALGTVLAVASFVLPPSISGRFLRRRTKNLII